jgi:hypothetical protein
VVVACNECFGFDRRRGKADIRSRRDEMKDRRFRPTIVMSSTRRGCLLPQSTESACFLLAPQRDLQLWCSREDASLRVTRISVAFLAPVYTALTIFFVKSILSVCSPSFLPGTLPLAPPIFFALNADLSACNTTSLSPWTS